jgi:hypothetical protein
MRLIGRFCCCCLFFRCLLVFVLYNYDVPLLDSVFYDCYDSKRATELSFVSLFVVVVVVVFLFFLL